MSRTREPDDLPILMRRRIQQTVTDETDGRLDGFADDVGPLLFEVCAHGGAFRFEGGGQALVFPGDVAAQSAAFDFEGRLRGKVAHALGVGVAYGVAEA